MDRFGDRYRYLDPGVDRLCLISDPRRRSSAGDHRNAEARSEAHRTLADLIFRFHPKRPIDLADNERRRGDPQSRWDRARADPWQLRHRVDLDRRPLLHQLAVNYRIDNRTADLRRDPDLCVQGPEADISRAWRDHG